MLNQSGKLIVFYGINNLGKSTQAKLLVEKLNASGKRAQYLKYPVYDLEPSGPLLNGYLRNRNPWQLTAREAQIMYAFNRSQYEPTLKSALDAGTIVVAEDYWGTGVAWGVGSGVDLDFLLKLNGQFIREDVAFLFTGTRFLDGVEQNHLHETNNELMERVSRAHQQLAQQFGWKEVRANDTIEAVHAAIWQETETIF